MSESTAVDETYPTRPDLGCPAVGVNVPYVAGAPFG